MSVVVRAARPPQESARAFAYRVLAMYIREMLFRPGEKLVEADIAAQLGISRTPVHATFEQLAREKLLDLGPRGATVPPLRAQAIGQQLWLQQVAGAAMLGQLYRQRPGRAALEPLEDHVAAEYRMLNGPDLVQGARSTWALHAQLYGLAGLAPVFRALQSAGPDLFRLFRLAEDRRFWQYVADRHAALVQALALHRHEDACRALAQQWAVAEPLLAHCRRTAPQFFV